MDAKASHDPGWYRLIIHTDASCGDHSVGIGYTIRIDGDVHKGSTSFEGNYTSMEAEYLALREAASVVARFFQPKEPIYFYTDCQGLVEKLTGPNDSDKWGEKRDRFRAILARVGAWTIQWVPRERNRDADALAHTARESVA